HPRLLLSFPTRRSSDLSTRRFTTSLAMCATKSRTRSIWRAFPLHKCKRVSLLAASIKCKEGTEWNRGNRSECIRDYSRRVDASRSEEHTSELQSRGHLV